MLFTASGRKLASSLHQLRTSSNSALCRWQELGDEFYTALERRAEAVATASLHGGTCVTCGQALPHASAAATAGGAQALLRHTLQVPNCNDSGKATIHIILKPTFGQALPNASGNVSTARGAQELLRSVLQVPVAAVDKFKFH